MVGVALVGAGCVSSERPVLEAPGRQVLPVPVCTTPLAPARRIEPGRVQIRSLDPEQWMAVVVPSFDEKKGLNPTDVDCTGHYVFANETLRFGVSLRGWPRSFDADDLDVRTGPKGVQTLRLRAVAFPNGDVGGPVALVRAVDDRAEVFGVGSYLGPADAELTPARMGNEFLLVAEAKRCPDVTNCRKVADFFLLRRGRLLNAAQVDLERVQRVPSVSERGLFAEYRLTTDVTYRPNGIELLEQVRVKIIPYEEKGDRDSDRILRTVEFKRILRVDRDALFASNESVWERVVGQD
jgi:hypothetical protein